MKRARETQPTRTLSVQLAELAAVLLLAAAVTASGIWVTDAKHRSRQLFVGLEQLNREQDQLQIDWGRLQIEQSTWATHPRIEALARERLHLTNPSDEQLVVVEPAK
ncbi:MAG TPA: cell division protein FtsL [Gammaproteobacteria bacterium]|jgi:cell division protein FtsL|nr:cell division protein FtsL [Gammaproteobacteria bacterium]